MGVSISVKSGFPKKQLKYAQLSRDEVARLQSQFSGEIEIVEPERRLYDLHCQNAVICSVAFLEGMTATYCNDEGINRDQIPNHLGVEEELAHIIDDLGYESEPLENQKEIQAIRQFRNDLIHFEATLVRAGKEYEEYNADELLADVGFPEYPLSDANQGYPFKWFSHELAETSVRMAFHVWRVFSRQQGREDELLSGVPSA